MNLRKLNQNAGERGDGLQAMANESNCITSESHDEVDGEEQELT